MSGRNSSFKDKAIHFWMYYKVRTIGFTVLFLVGIAVIVNYLSYDPQGELQIAVQSRCINSEKVADWKEQLCKKYDIDQEEIKIRLMWTGAPAGYPENRISYMHFVAGIQLEQIDLIIGDANSMIDSPALDSYFTLNEIFDEEELDILFSAAEVNAGNSANGILKAKVVDDETVIFDSKLSEKDPDTKCYFACVGELPNNITGEDAVYIGIVRNTPNLDIAKQFLNDLVVGD